MTPRARKVAMLLTGCALLAALPRAARAEWAIRTSEPVPVRRLVKNIQSYIDVHPNDAQGYYVLGRVHSRAFAEGTETLTTYQPRGTFSAGENPSASLPEVSGPEQSIEEQRRKGIAAPDSEAIVHLTESIRNYRRAVQLGPREALYFLGLGWMLEQGIRYAEQVEAPFTDKPARVAQTEWRKQALVAYRRAYALRIDADMKKEYFGPGADTDISREAGEGILRLLDVARATPEEMAEIALVSVAVKKMTAKGTAITPIIFPLPGPAPLDALLASQSHVAFDLAGDGRPVEWPWVNADAAFLVWDPGNQKRIVSGRQLFGNATWWMFWRDGYQALAALDDDGNGWLEGSELAGIAVWRDLNGNGICDPGEVISLREAGIARIAVKAAGSEGETQFNLQGIQFEDGTYVPTYDWTPHSLATPRSVAPGERRPAP
ncbi:MAG TPA: hypothetical protein VMI93_09705 [Candidatus Solibacter sp.]|nr:hypothetical protein [Candidatus Solibacter sp.]